MPAFYKLYPPTQADDSQFTHQTPAQQNLFKITVHLLKINLCSC